MEKNSKSELLLKRRQLQIAKE